MVFVGLLLSDKERAAPLAAELVAEEFQEIELAWQSTAQRSLGHAPRAQAVPVEGLLEAALTAAAKPESFAAAEPAREQAAPPGEPEASLLPARKRGRPRRAEGREKKEMKSQAAGGKRHSCLILIFQPAWMARESFLRINESWIAYGQHHQRKQNSSINTDFHFHAVSRFL